MSSLAQRANAWRKEDACRWQNTSNGAFIAKFNFGLKRNPFKFLVYLNRENYQKSGADYRSFDSLKEAKDAGNDVSELELIDIAGKR